MSDPGKHDAEAELLRRAQGGDDAAIQELLRRWQPSLENIARSFQRRHSRLGFDTHDLVSTTIRRILRIDPNAIGASSGRSLLARILRGAYVDKVRDEVGRRRRQAEALRRAPPAAREADDEQPALTEIPRDLAPDDWELVLLWKQGLSWTQISDHLGVPYETARRRWHRLIQRLRGGQSLSKDAGAAELPVDSPEPPEAAPPSDRAEGQDPASDPKA